MKYNMSYVNRFNSKIDKTDTCWLWLGYCNPKGYGYFYDGFGMNRVHRFAYRVFVGEIPEDCEIDHLCRVRNCVNPDHLEAVTHRVNCQRGIGSKTHCKQGHEFTEDNIYRRPNGNRRCKRCADDGNKLIRRIRKALAC